MSPELATRVKRLKRQYALNAVTSMILGLWTLVAPSSFWGAIGINGSDPIVQAIYGGAICGEGVLNGLGVAKPLRYLVILQYMMVYKAFVVVGLVPRLALMDAAPLAGWLVVAAWAFAGLQSAWIFPWRKWPEVVEAMKSE